MSVSAHRRKLPVDHYPEVLIKRGRQREERFFESNSEADRGSDSTFYLLHEPTIFDFQRGSGPLAEPHSFRERGLQFNFGVEFNIFKRRTF